LKLKFKYAVLILLSGAFAPAGHATPLYNLTAGTLTYVNNFLGFSEGDMFSFTGPQPVSVQGSGGNNVSYSVFQTLNTPFTIALPLLIDDTGNESGPASANGINYGGSQYGSPGSLQLTNSTPITLTAGHLTVSVAAVITGQMSVCTPDASCPGGSNPFDVDFGALAGTLTVTYAQLNQGSQYTLTSASFTAPSTPEPATFLSLAGGLALLGLAAATKRLRS
jgi:hypothetical protein